jgi:hypothetical protein
MKILAPLDVTGNAILNVPTPTAGTDGANKAYVDSKAGSGGALGFRTSGQGNTFTNVATVTYISIPGVYLGAGRSYRFHVNFYIQNVGAVASVFDARLDLPGGPIIVWQQTIPASAVSGSYWPLVIDFLYIPATTVTQTVNLSFTATGSGRMSGGNGGILWIEDAGGSAYDNTIGLIGSSTATTDQAMTLTGGAATVDTLAVTANIRSGEKYRLTVSNAYSKTSAYIGLVYADMFDGVVNAQVFIRTFDANNSDGYLIGQWFYTATRTATVTFNVRYGSGAAMSAGAWTLKGSATMPRQLAIERIQV